MMIKKGGQLTYCLDTNLLSTISLLIMSVGFFLKVQQAPFICDVDGYDEPTIVQFVSLIAKNIILYIFSRISNYTVN